MVSKYWKAVIAVLGVLGTTFATVASDPDILKAIPTGWGAAVLTAGTVITGAITVMKRNQMTVDQIDKALEAGEISLADMQELLTRWEQSR